jgi:hypothetical protein
MHPLFEQMGRFWVMEAQLFNPSAKFPKHHHACVHFLCRCILIPAKNGARTAARFSKFRDHIRVEQEGHEGLFQINLAMSLVALGNVIH